MTLREENTRLKAENLDLLLKLAVKEKELELTEGMLQQVRVELSEERNTGREERERLLEKLVEKPKPASLEPAPELDSVVEELVQNVEIQTVGSFVQNFNAVHGNALMPHPLMLSYQAAEAKDKLDGGEK